MIRYFGLGGGVKLPAMKLKTLVITERLSISINGTINQLRSSNVSVVFLLNPT